MSEYLSPEQIAEQTKDLFGLAERRAINALYRAQDESRLYPINGEFNATERAIRQANKYERGAGPVYGLEYCYLLDSLLSQIVNGEQ